MADLTIMKCATHEEFTRAWVGSETDRRMLWQLLGQLDPDEVLVQLPEWLAREKVGYVNGATPATFVGRIERETEKAILLGDAADARSLMKIAHRIHQLKQGNATGDSREWMEEKRGWVIVTPGERSLDSRRRQVSLPQDSPRSPIAGRPTKVLA